MKVNLNQKQFVRGAFTLVELLAVLTVLALVAAISVPRLGGIRKRMAHKTAVSQLTRLDRRARNLASKSQATVALRIDVDKNQLWCELDGRQSGQTLLLPGAARIVGFISPREKKTSGRATIRFRRAGSESYAIKLASSEQAGSWLLFAGVSGQLTEIESQRYIDDVFEQLKQETGNDVN